MTHSTSGRMLLGDGPEFPPTGWVCRHEADDYLEFRHEQSRSTAWTKRVTTGDLTTWDTYYRICANEADTVVEGGSVQTREEALESLFELMRSADERGHPHPQRHAGDS